MEGAAMTIERLGSLPALLLSVAVVMANDVPARGATVIGVVGAPGEPQFERAFSDWAAAWSEAATAGNAAWVCIGAPPSPTNEMQASDRELLMHALEREEKDTEEPLWVVLIGHGTFDGNDAKFNLRGPDVSAAELNRWLESFGRPIAIINCASASGPFVNALSGTNRVVLSATRSGYEYDYARFGKYLAEAMQRRVDDLDKDEQVSLLEAFLAASNRTQEFYDEQERLSTEHALIDDNADGLGTPGNWFRGIHATRRAQDDTELDGVEAARWVLVPSPFEQEIPPEIRRQRDELETKLAELRERREEYTEKAYIAAIEPILIELALLYERLELRGVGFEAGPTDPPSP